MYAPVISGDYIWDDNDYVSQNPNLDTWQGLWRIWSDPRSSPQYYPLVFSSYWIERHLYGPGPTAHHVGNLLLHVLNAWLVWRILSRLRVPGAPVAALVFAVHPVHLESVAWITERKNVLSGAFYLGSLWAYAAVVWPEHADGREAGGPRSTPPGKAYLLSLLLFAGALLSKTVTATLPAVLLVLHWWKDHRITVRDLGRVTPFVVLGAAAGSVTVWLEMHHVGAIGEAWALSVLDRLLLAGRVPWFYAGKLLWPDPLIFFYPQWQMSLSLAQVIFPLATVGSLAGLYALRARVGRGPFVAAACFIITLLPVLGFFNVYPMRYAYVADHFQYLASIGIIALVVGAGARLLGRDGVPRLAGVAAAAVVVVVLATVGRAETAKYRDLESLWADTIAKNPDAWMAHNNLGTMRLRQQRWSDAERHFAAALRIKADAPEANKNLGTALYSQGKIDEAVAQYRVAVTVTPEDAGAWNNLGIALAAGGRFDEARQAYRTALNLSPSYAMAHYNLGNVSYRTGDLASAVGSYRTAVRLDPNLAMAHYNLGLILLGQRDEDADAHLRRAFALLPGFALGHYQVGATQMALGLASQAVESYTAAVEADPSYADAYSARGEALVRLGRHADAVRDYVEALRLNPDLPGARSALESLERSSRRQIP